MNKVHVSVLQSPGSTRDLYLDEFFFYLSGICESGRYPVLHITPNLRVESRTNYDCIISFNS